MMFLGPESITVELLPKDSQVQLEFIGAQLLTTFA